MQQRTRASMYVVEGSPLLNIFSGELSKKQSVNSDFIIRVLDPILPVWFRCPKIKLIFCFGYAVVRDGLKPFYSFTAANVADSSKLKAATWLTILLAY